MTGNGIHSTMTILQLLLTYQLVKSTEWGIIVMGSVRRDGVILLPKPSYASFIPTDILNVNILFSVAFCASQMISTLQEPYK